MAFSLITAINHSAEFSLFMHVHFSLSLHQTHILFSYCFDVQKAEWDAQEEACSAHQQGTEPGPRWRL